MATENLTRWLVSWTSEDGNERCAECLTLDEAIPIMHGHRSESSRLWEPARFPVQFPDEPTPTPPKKRARRKRNSSPAPEQAAPASSPVAAAAAQESGDVPAPAPPSPVKAVLSCGGTRCTKVAGGNEVHDALTCPQYQRLDEWRRNPR